MTLKTQVYV